MTVIEETVHKPGGLLANASDTVTIELALVGTNGRPIVGFHALSSTTISSPDTFVLPGSGEWTRDLRPNAQIVPAGTTYRRIVKGPNYEYLDYFDVPTAGGPYQLQERLTAAPASVADSALGAHIAKFHEPYVHVPSDWGTNWKAKRLLGASQLVKVNIWGDSICSAGSAATNVRTLSMPGLIETSLQAAYGAGGSGFLSHEYATKTGTWTTSGTSAVGGVGGAAARATAAASMQWTGVVGPTVKILHKNAGLTGSFRWRVDGGAWNTVTPPTGFGLEPGVAELLGLSDTAHTVDVEWVSGTVSISGVYSERANGINVRRLGTGGRAVSDYSFNTVEQIPNVTTTNASATITTPGAGSFRNWHIGKYIRGTGIAEDVTITAVASATSATISTAATASGTITADININKGSIADSPRQDVEPFLVTSLGRCDLLIIELGVNDPANFTNNMNSMHDGLGRIVKQHMTGTDRNWTPDVIIGIEHHGDWFDQLGNWPRYASTLAAFAKGIGAAVVDHWGIGRRSHQYGQDQLWFADTVHPTDLGHSQMYAAPIIDLLLS